MSEGAARATGHELGLFVLWPNGRQHDALLLEHLRSRFELLDVTEVTWTPEHTSAGYSRFFAYHAPYTKSDLRTKGVGSALVICVLDDAPGSESRATAECSRGAGSNLVGAAEVLRAQIGADALHAAAGPHQAAREYMLLLEQDAADLVGGRLWPGTVTSLARDLAGTGGWDDTQHMFSTLNLGTPYVVLRNYEGLADLAFLPGHADIDILAADYAEVAANLGGVSRIGAFPRNGGRFDVRIGPKTVICDLRFPGDDYYDPAWAAEILRSRRLHPDGFYVPDETEHLESLLYHAVVHKPLVSQDYQTRVHAMALELRRSEFDAATLASSTGAKRLVTDLLTSRGYTIRRPKDPTVYFNHRAQGWRTPRLARLGAALWRRVYRVSMRRVCHPLQVAATSTRGLIPAGMLSPRGRRQKAAGSGATDPSRDSGGDSLRP